MKQVPAFKAISWKTVKGYYVSLLKKVIVLYLQIDKFTLRACVRASQMAPETLTCHQAVFLLFFFLLRMKVGGWAKGGKAKSLVLKKKGKKGITGWAVFSGLPVVSIQADLVEVYINKYV